MLCCYGLLVIVCVCGLVCFDYWLPGGFAVCCFDLVQFAGLLTCVCLCFGLLIML